MDADIKRLWDAISSYAESENLVEHCDAHGIIIDCLLRDFRLSQSDATSVAAAFDRILKSTSGHQSENALKEFSQELHRLKIAERLVDQTSRDA